MKRNVVPPLYSQVCIVFWRVCSNTDTLLLVATGGFLEEQVSEKSDYKSGSESQSHLGCSCAGQCSDLNLEPNNQANGSENFPVQGEVEDI